METVKSISFECKENGSNKEYHIQIVKSGSEFLINFQYGAIGSTLRPGTKTPSPISEGEAEKLFQKLIKERLAKNYKPSGESKDTGFSGPTIQSKEVVMLPQLLNAIDDVDKYINDDEYIAQEKFDGNRQMIISGNGIVIGLNKKGIAIQLQKLIIDAVKYFECIIDGEIIGEKLFVFDILSLNGEDLKNLAVVQRLKVLGYLKFGKAIEIVKTAYTREEKQKMYDKLVANNSEGIVFKLKSSPYTAGRPNSGGNSLKYKFIKEASFIVQGHTKGKRSIELGLIDNGNRVFMGKCTVPPNKTVPEIGSVVEVKYLYCYLGGCIFQPVYKEQRTDVDLNECVMSQIVYKQGQEVEVED